MLAVKKSGKRRLVCSPASAISFGASIADAAGWMIADGTMIASAWLDPTAECYRRPPRSALRT
jgi:hypothetical protein